MSHISTTSGFSHTRFKSAICNFFISFRCFRVNPSSGLFFSSSSSESASSEDEENSSSTSFSSSLPFFVFFFFVFFFNVFFFSSRWIRSFSNVFSPSFAGFSTNASNTLRISSETSASKIVSNGAATYSTSTVGVPFPLFFFFSVVVVFVKAANEEFSFFFFFSFASFFFNRRFSATPMILKKKCYKREE